MLFSNDFCDKEIAGTSLGDRMKNVGIIYSRKRRVLVVCF